MYMISTNMWAFWFLIVLTALGIEPMAVDAKQALYCLRWS